MSLKPEIRERNDPRLEPDQIRAVAAILHALGEVHADRRLDALAAATRVYLDAVGGRFDRPSFARLIEITGLNQ